jgi:hypothetical protein
MLVTRQTLSVRGGCWEELKEDGLIVMAGRESMERYQTHGNHNSVPFIPFQPFQ